MSSLNYLLLGTVAMGMFAIALFFFRFWREGRDRLFLLFALSFLIQAINRVALALTEQPNEGSPWFYGVRLVAYGLIIAAIVDKNREAVRQRGGTLPATAGTRDL